MNEKGKLLRKAFLWKANERITMAEIVKRPTSTAKMNSIFQVIASIKGNTEQNKTGPPEVKFRNSGWVASTGIEPVSGASETLILSIVLRGLLFEPEVNSSEFGIRL
jgi:hypothetical protein